MPWAGRLGPEAECAGLTSWSLKLHGEGWLAWQGVGAVGSPGPVIEQGLRAVPRVRRGPRTGCIFPGWEDSALEGLRPWRGCLAHFRRRLG